MAKDPKKQAKAMYKKMKRKAKVKGSKFFDKKKYVAGQAKRMSKNKTWPEKEFEKLMKELNVDYEEQKILGLKIFDFYLPSINTIVEVDGNYFHGDTEKYAVLNNMQKRNVKNDKFKDVLAIGMGYKIERVWESDLKENYADVKTRFKKLLEHESE
jgi:very-short-patch-repair endonuclease